MKKAHLAALFLVPAFGLASTSIARADDEEETAHVSEYSSRAPLPEPLVPRARQETFIAHARTTPDGDLLLGGGFLFGIGYGAAALVAANSDLPADDYLKYPVVGPWLNLANRPACGKGRGAPRCESERAHKGLLVADGILQGVGVLEFVAGLVMPKTEIVIMRKPVSIGASVTPSSAGISASGRF